MTVVTLPGRGRLKIPVVGTAKSREASGISKATKEWTVRMDSIFAHTADLYWRDTPAGEEPPTTTEIELFGFTYNTQRETLSHSVNQLIACASIRHSDLIIIIQNATYSPILEQYMNDGTLIREVVLHRSGFIGGVNCILEERWFKDCYITRFIQVLDFVVLHIRVLAREESSYIYAQDTTSQGMSVSAVDFRTGSSDAAFLG